MSTNSEEAFEVWVTQMPESIEDFFGSVPGELAGKLDFSPDSLRELEAWMLAAFPDMECFSKDADIKVVDGTARYIGETLRRNLGGSWDIRLQNKKHVYYGMPIITGLRGNGTPVCPHFLATTLLHRRTGTFLGDLYGTVGT